MNFLTSAMLKLPEFNSLAAAVDSQVLPAAATGLSGIHKATILYSLCALKKRRAFVVASDEAEAQRLCDDLTAMGMSALVYPMRDFNLRDTEGNSHEYEHQRLQVLSRTLNGECDCVISCIDAALQYTIPPQELKKRTITLRTAQTVPLNQVVEALVACGYERAEQIDGTGQFSVRGGILDFFTPDAPSPVRIEFWGDDIDTISFFDLESQRRTESMEQITIAPSVEVLVTNPEQLAQKITKHAATLRGKTAPAAKTVLAAQAERLSNHLHIGCADKFISMIYEHPATLFDYAGDDFLLFVSEPSKGKERVRTTLWQWGEDIKFIKK